MMANEWSLMVHNMGSYWFIWLFSYLSTWVGVLSNQVGCESRIVLTGHSDRVYYDERPGTPFVHRNHKQNSSRIPWRVVSCLHPIIRQTSHSQPTSPISMLLWSLMINKIHRVMTTLTSHKSRMTHRRRIHMIHNQAVSSTWAVGSGHGGSAGIMVEPSFYLLLKQYFQSFTQYLAIIYLKYPKLVYECWTEPVAHDIANISPMPNYRFPSFDYFDGKLPC